MKKIFFILIITIIAFEAQASNPSDIKVVNPQIKKIDNLLAVDFEITTNEFSPNQKVKIIPIIYNGNNSWKTLEHITIVGRRRDIYDRRTNYVHDGYVREVIKRNKTQPVKYTTIIPYEDWMQYISLSVDMIFEGCCVQTDILMQNIAEPRLTYYDITSYYDDTQLHYELSELEQYTLNNPFLHPMEEHSRRYDILINDREKGTSEMVFTVGSSVIDMSNQKNQDVAEALREAFRLIEEDPNATLKHIMIAGYASPEGPLAGNTALAQRRAESVRNFIMTLLSNPSADLFELYNGREDWDGLRAMVYRSDMEEKVEVLEIIDAFTMEQEIRKTRLRQLRDGVPYAYMLENFYPALRSAGYVQVFYEIDRKASVAAAFTDEFGRTIWLDPDLPANKAVTFINRALEHMKENRFNEALEELLQVADDPRTWNNIGVCYMLTGRFDEADVFFIKAVENGDQNAVKNREEVRWARKVK